jgi:hypothetical protein
MRIDVKKWNLLWWVAAGVLLALTACGGNDVDSTPPTAGAAISLDGSQETSIDATWGAATDNRTVAADLEYQVMRSTSDNMSSVADALANGTIATTWTKNITASTLTGLQDGTTYYVTVLVRDGAGNMAVYSTMSTTTAAVVASTNLLCPDGKFVTGFAGRRGGIIDRFTLRCGDADNLATVVDGDSLGGVGGSAFGPYDCPSGEYVTGTSGFNALGGFTTAMASVKMTCSGGTDTTSANSGGNTAFSFSCPSPLRVRGFVVTDTDAGAYVGFMQNIICEQPT